MIGFVVPSGKEGKALLERLENKTEKVISGRRITSGDLAGRPCAVVITQAGKIRTASGTQLLIDHFSPHRIFHFGCAGALAPSLKIGDIVLGEMVVEHDYHCAFGDPEPFPQTESTPELLNAFKVYLESKGLRFQRGLLVSGNEDIVTSMRRDELYQRFSGLSVDWESAACLQVANTSGVPVLVVRIISDLAYEHTAKEFSAQVAPVSKTLCDLLSGFVITDES